MRCTAIILLASMVALSGGPALAWVPSPGEALSLSKGQMILEVTPDKDGVSGAIRAGIEIEARPDAVWRALVDCDLAAKMVANLHSCRVLERDPEGRFDIREHVSKPVLFFPPVRNIFRSDYDPPRGFRIHRTGGDLKVLEGQWKLISLRDGARTRALYEGRAAAPFSVPRPIARLVLREQVATGLIALRRESMAKPERPRP
jgi:hypothetical protein